MTIDSKREDDRLTISIEGKINALNSQELEDILMENLTGVNALAFDLSGLVYISSSGLRALLGAQQMMDERGGKMTIKGTNEDIMEIFDVTGFSEFLHYE